MFKFSTKEWLLTCDIGTQTIWEGRKLADSIGLVRSLCEARVRQSLFSNIGAQTHGGAYQNNTSITFVAPISRPRLLSSYCNISWLTKNTFAVLPKQSILVLHLFHLYFIIWRHKSLLI